jgi:hypothetical protein
MTKRDFGLEHLRASVAKASRRVPSVSDWSIGMHIHHCCLAMIGICESVRDSVPPPPRSGFSLVPWLIFTSGRIPRGRGKSPDIVLPRPDVSSTELHAFLDQSEQLLAQADDLDPQTWFRHFAFGVLPRDKTLRFIQIHNRHHLKIIADIAAA